MEGWRIGGREEGGRIGGREEGGRIEGREEGGKEDWREGGEREEGGREEIEGEGMQGRQRRKWTQMIKAMYCTGSIKSRVSWPS